MGWGGGWGGMRRGGEWAGARRPCSRPEPELSSPSVQRCQWESSPKDQESSRDHLHRHPSRDHPHPSRDLHPHPSRDLHPHPARDPHPHPPRDQRTAGGEWAVVRRHDREAEFSTGVGPAGPGKLSSGVGPARPGKIEISTGVAPARPGKLSSGEALLVLGNRVGSSWEIE